MVVPIRKLGNFTHSSAAMSQLSSNLILSQDIDMAVDSVKAMFNLNDKFNEVRDHSLDLNIHRPRSPSPSLLVSDCDKEYYVCVQQESNKMDKDKPISLLGNVELEYVTPKSQPNQVSKAADPPSNMRQQCAPTVSSTLNQPHSENVVNIHLNYDSNQALDLESWDGNFQAISLYGSMEHLALDALNIKKSLIRMKKFIAGKSINGDKANDVKDLEGMGKAIWKFIAIVYELY